MIKSYESYPEAGLQVARGALSPDLAKQLEEDCRVYMDLPDSKVSQNNRQADIADGYPVHRLFTAETLVKIGRPATSRILDKLGMLKGYTVAINYQPPNSSQPFHSDDHTEAPVVVVQASNNGEFDYAIEEGLNPEELEQNHKQLGVNAGDIVAQFRPAQEHRGVNPSRLGRYNMVIFREKSEQ